MRNRELDLLFANRSFDLKDWVVGKIPNHYKRLSISIERAIKLARYGASQMAGWFGDKLYFTQSVIAGAVLSGEFDEIVWVSPPQYGKTWLFGRLALKKSYDGNRVYIAAATADKTAMMMSQTVSATQDASIDIKKALTAKVTEVEKLSQSLSKKKIGFVNGGLVEPITLGDAYSDNLTANAAVGRGGIVFADEAALCSDAALRETDRRRFSNIDGSTNMLAMVSNPHKPGYFYDKLTQEEVPERTLVVWMDALTAVEEERWTEELYYESDFAKSKSTLRRYILCILDTDGSGMFETPIVTDEPIEDEYAQHFLGIDSAYKGRDNICLALCTVYEKNEQMIFRIEEIETVDKKIWVEGKTGEDVVNDVIRLIHNERILYTCIDTGQGIWLTEGLQNRLGNYMVKGINFNERPTPKRVKAGQYAATNARNVRAEMHLDMQGLIDDGQLEFTPYAYEKVKDTLPFVTAERKSNGLIQVMTKPQLKVHVGRSPDELDSVLLSIHAGILYGGTNAEAIV